MEGMGMNPLMFLLNGQWHLVVVMPPMEKGRSCGVKPAQELGAFTEIFISVDLCIYITMIAYLEYARFQPYGCGWKKKYLEYLG